MKYVQSLELLEEAGGANGGPIKIMRDRDLETLTQTHSPQIVGFWALRFQI